MAVSPYNTEQQEALDQALQGISTMTADEISRIKASTEPYLQFREEVRNFSETHLFPLCKTKCYETGLSACCTKEGIITYFADMVINFLHSDAGQIARIREALARPRNDGFCVYLGETGCLWRIKPIVCDMFFCDWLLEAAALNNPMIVTRIAQFKTLQKQFTWPDKPVLFDAMETIFLEKKLKAATMYYHFSPGLKAIKKKAGVP
jgi:hypothetical protein